MSNPNTAAALADLIALLEYERDEDRHASTADRERLRRFVAACAPSPDAGQATPAAGVVAEQPAVAHDAATDVPAALAAIAKQAAACTKCNLHKSRKQAVPGQGCPTPEIMFIGEAPGADEDRTGQAFVGAAGQLLTRMIAGMGYSRDEVFIANILKCRPPGNRTPGVDEMDCCLPFLKAQIQLLQPKVMVLLGAVAARGLLRAPSLSAVRGKWRKFEDIPVLATYHPAYLLRTEEAKGAAWTDLKEVLRFLGRTPPPRK